jgi:peptidoglycan/xylan/chitin deacetylase (PgdA/CDA1 family)
MGGLVARKRSSTAGAALAAALSLVLTACGGAASSSSSGPSLTPSASSPGTSSTAAASPSPGDSSSGATGLPSPPPSTSRTPSSTSAPTDPPPVLIGVDLRRIPTTSKVAALTFDGGSNAAGLDRILRTLEAEHVRATFFLTGRWVESYPSGARAVTAAGHVVGNHTFTHVHVTQVTDAVLTTEVTAAERIIRSTTGHDPRPWFRFPYGERTSSDVAVLNHLGYACIGWTVDSLGWLGTSRGDASDVRDRVVESAVPGMIVLMHLGSNPDDGTTFDADALASIIAGLRARGYTFVTVASLL